MSLEQFVDALRPQVLDDQIVRGRARLESYSHDWWPLSVKLKHLGRHDHTPDLGVLARSEADVVNVLRAATAAGVTVTPRGLGSAVTGAPLPVGGGILLDLSELVGDPVINDTDHTVTVAGGVLGWTLEALLNQRGFTLGHSPQSLDRSSVGGWLATLATGQFSSRYGGIEDLVVGYRIVLADGEVIDLRAHPRAAMGPDLRQYFLGSEGTLGVITQVTLKLFPLPEYRVVEAFRIASVTGGLDAMRRISQSGLRPFLVRFYDAAEARHAMKDPSFDSPVLFVGHEGIRAVAEAEHAAASAMIVTRGGSSIGSAPVEGWLGRRYDFSTIERRLEEVGGYAETIEVAADWSSIHRLYEALTAALRPLADQVLGHFSHIYPQGTSLYVILLGSAATDEEAAERIRQIWAAAMTATKSSGGELSHHHGAGLARKPYIADLNPGVTALARRIKAALDPRGTLNPGKLFCSGT